MTGAPLAAFPFGARAAAGIVEWRGQPTCDAGHDGYLVYLGACPSPWLAADDRLTSTDVGNLGEGLSFYIAAETVFEGWHHYPANAHDPLSRTARQEIDVLYARFAEDSSEDALAVQEVKTTGDPSLGYASELVADYRKLHDAANHPTLTLPIRVARFALFLRSAAGRPDLASRVVRVCGDRPSSCPSVRLLPTLVHDRSVSAATKLDGVRASIIALGWPAGAVEAWSIALADVMTRFERLARGEH